jgi:glycosyltransferase involved in cell wall biosynthesis
MADHFGKVRSLSIVMPYYNEELNIERSIGGALDYLRKRFDDYEVVAVDDCSKDRTLELARAMQAAEPRLKVVALPANSKFAGALKAGFAAASKEYVFYTDGDCPIEFDDIDAAIALLDNCDVAVGYRTTRDQEGILRKLYTNGYRLTLRFLLGLNFRDVNFSFKLFPKKSLDCIGIDSNGSFIDAEILYKLKKAGCCVGEIPVRYHSRRLGESTLASPTIIFRIVRELFAFWLAHRKTPACAPARRLDESADSADRQR